MSHWRDVLDPDARGGRFLPWREVARATGLSRTTAWRLQKRDEFPAPYVISPGRVGYREDEVEAWRVSRDHSAARVRSPATDNKAAPSTDLPPPGAAPAKVSPPVVVTESPAEDVASPIPARPAARPAPPRDAGSPSAKARNVSRRRSQHAQAIAQQILFDF